jgi:hypothetical protein
METLVETGGSVYSNSGEKSSLPPIGTSNAPFGIFIASDVSTIEGVTDAGRGIPLFHYLASFILPPGMRLDPNNQAQCESAFCSSETQFLANSKQDVSHFTRLKNPDLGSNCHGWVFTGGRFGIKDEFVPNILADHGYVKVTEPDAGDIAIYFKDGMALHSALVKPDANGHVFVEGKYGPFSVFRHAPQDLLFHGDYSFFRTRRGSHILSLRLHNS